MIELGKKGEIFGADKLKPLMPTLYDRPQVMPRVPQGNAVICGYDQGLGEHIIVCETLQDMQAIYDRYAKGWALNIYWYIGEDPGFVTAIAPSTVTPPGKAKLVLHYDDSPCKVRLAASGFCPVCKYHPDMQSTAFWFYCPACDVPLKSLECPTCHVVFRKP